MKSFKIIIYTLIILFAGCKDEDKLRYEFMERSIQHPDKIESYARRFPRNTQPFIEAYLEDERNREEKTTFLITTIKRYFPEGKFEVACDRKYDAFNKKRLMQNSYHEVIYKGNAANRFLRFEWIFEVNRYRLHDIDIINEFNCLK